MRNILLTAVAVSALAAPAFAQSAAPEAPRGYGSLGYTYLDDAYTGAVTGRLGVNLNRYLAVETEASVGVRDHDYELAGADGTLKHEWDAAGYVVGKYPIGDRMELFARGGYGHTELKQEIAGQTADVGGDHWSYGAGATYNLDGANGVRADWTRRDFDGDSNELDSYTLSYVRRF